MPGWAAQGMPWVAARAGTGLALGLVVRQLCVGTIDTTLVGAYRIPSGSMQPTLLFGDHIVVDRLAYGVRLPLVGQVAALHVPRRGDVVVIRYPPDPSITYVERVVGLPGERVAFRDNHVVIDGVELASEPGPDTEVMDDTCATFRDRSFTEHDGDRSWTVVVRAGASGPLATRREVEVPVGTVFVAGDARDDSEDSRRWGVVPLSDVLGRVQDRMFSWDDCTQHTRLERFGTAVGP